MTAPLVTVITPAYNRASYVGEVIESVLGQDYPSLEYIVLDDGSTDDTLDVIRRYDGRVRWETNPNAGENATVNRGLGMATGELIGVVNSDDPLLPGAIRALVEYLQAHPDILAVYPDWYMIDADGKIIKQIRTYDYSYLDMLRWHHCIPGPGAFFRRKLLELTGGRDDSFRYTADYEFWLRGGLYGPFARYPRPLATFRHHAGGASLGARGARMAAEHMRLVEKIYSLPDLPPDVLAVRDEAFSSAAYIAGVVCGNNLPVEQRGYFLSAFRTAPLKYLWSHLKRLDIMVTASPAYIRALRPFVRALHALLPVQYCGTDLPTVTVIVPADGDTQAIARSVQSVLAQSFADFDLLLVSRGDISAAVARLADGDPRVRCVANAGEAASWRWHAAGTYVSFVQPGDVLEPSKLQRQVRALESAPRAAISHTAYTSTTACSSGASPAPSTLMIRRQALGEKSLPSLLAALESGTLWSALGQDHQAIGIDEALVRANGR